MQKPATVILGLLLALWGGGGCGTRGKLETQHQETRNRETQSEIHHASRLIDSLYRRDTVRIREVGDTVFVDHIRHRDHFRVQRDTLRLYDTVKILLREKHVTEATLPEHPRKDEKPSLFRRLENSAKHLLKGILIAAAAIALLKIKRKK